MEPTMCEVAEILKECISELRAVDVKTPGIDLLYETPIYGKNLGVKRPRSRVKLPEKLDLGIPLWYKDVEENNASRFFLSSKINLNIMEPKTMEKDTASTKTFTQADVDAAIAKATAELVAAKEALLKDAADAKAKTEEAQAGEAKAEEAASKGKWSTIVIVGLVVAGIAARVYQRSKYNQEQEAEASM
jgi:hypothetical protein